MKRWLIHPPRQDQEELQRAWEHKDVNDRSAWVTGAAAQCCSPLCAVINCAIRLTPIWSNWPFPTLIMVFSQFWALGTEFALEDLTVLPLISTQLSSPLADELHPNKPSCCHCPRSSLLAKLSLPPLLPTRQSNAHVEGASMWGWQSPTADGCGITHQGIHTAERHGGAICCQASPMWHSPMPCVTLCCVTQVQQCVQSQLRSLTWYSAWVTLAHPTPWQHPPTLGGF